jgi:transcription elongation factor GreB
VNKAFVRESEGDHEGDGDDELPGLPPLPAGARNYITPQGYARLRGELMTLLDVERPKVVETVSWAAKNGDRSENGDYLYGKKRLREIDRRIRFLTRRLDIAEVADPSAVTIKGIDEADSLAGEVSWISPIARALLKAHEGDEVQVVTPGGVERIEVVAVRYPAPH